MLSTSNRVIEVEKIVPPIYIYHKLRNNYGKIPRELFTEENMLLLREGEKRMKDTANSCMIVPTLIATMVFVVVFTVPGGNNGDDGIPILLKLNGFTAFDMPKQAHCFLYWCSCI